MGLLELAPIAKGAPNGASEAEEVPIGDEKVRWKVEFPAEGVCDCCLVETVLSNTNRISKRGEGR